MGRFGGGEHKGTQNENNRRKKRNSSRNDKPNIVVVSMEKIKEIFIVQNNENEEWDFKLPACIFFAFFSLVILYSILSILKEYL